MGTTAQWILFSPVRAYSAGPDRCVDSTADQLEHCETDRFHVLQNQDFETPRRQGWVRHIEQVLFSNNRRPSQTAATLTKVNAPRWGSINKIA